MQFSQLSGTANVVSNGGIMAVDGQMACMVLIRFAML